MTTDNCTYISLAEVAEREAALVQRAEAAERELLTQGDMYDRLHSASFRLLQFIREKYPEDFAPGGKGFTCPYHQAIDQALTA